MSLHEGDSAKFHRESFVGGTQSASGKKCGARVVPAPEMSQSAAVVVIDLGATLGSGLHFTDNLTPLFLVKEFLNCGEMRCGRRLRASGEGKAGEQEEET